MFPSYFVRALKARPLDVLQWLPFRATSVDLDWRDAVVVGAELRDIAAVMLRCPARAPARTTAMEP